MIYKFMKRINKIFKDNVLVDGQLYWLAYTTALINRYL